MHLLYLLLRSSPQSEPRQFYRSFTMSISTRRQFIASSSAGIIGTAAGFPAIAANRRKIDRRIDSALRDLEENTPNLAGLVDSSAGVLLMPRVRRAGLGFGAAYGEGALLIGRAPVEYYSVAAASFGLQIGIQQYSSALFFTSEKRLAKFRNRDGWTVGADLEYTAWDLGDSADIDTVTASDEVYGVVFGQEGLHIGATLEGSKYSRISR
jgi:lipid-binding SYLF domain-containing protein